MSTTVRFVEDVYGNYQDNYYTDKYDILIELLQAKSDLTWSGNLGIIDGVVIMNKFSGDFTKYNCAIVEHDTQGKHIYKIIKKVFIKRNLWQITMVKDLVSSKYESILNSKVLVSRLGIPRNVPDSLLFLDEPMQLSEIKVGQRIINELEDTKSYGYLLIWARDSLDGEHVTWNSSPIPSREYDILVTNLSDLPIFNKKLLINENAKRFVTNVRNSGTLYQSNWTVYLNDQSVNRQRFSIVLEGQSITSQVNAILTSGIEHVDTITNSINYRNGTQVISRLRETYLTKHTEFEYIPDYASYNGKVVFESSTGKYYELVLNDTTNNSYVEDISTTEIKYILNLESSTNIIFNNPVGYRLTVSSTTYSYNELPDTEQPITHRFGEFANVIDQPFQMMFIPVIENGTFLYSDSTFTTNKLIIEHMIYDLIAEYGGENAKLLDVQIIPYSPIDGYANNWHVREPEQGNFYNLDESNVKEVITLGEDGLIAMFEVAYASYIKEIPMNIIVDDYKLDQKRKYHITSPSGGTIYEFSVAKNGGLVGFNIKVDLRPFASFHCLQPIYGNMYGGNYTDTRGLIWQEDTSLTQISSAWESYKRQNINYMNIFNSEQNYKRSNLSLTHEANWGNFGFDSGKRIIEAGVEAAKFVADAVADDALFGIKGTGAGALGAGAIMAGALVTEGIEAGQLAYNNKMDTKILSNEISYAQQQFNFTLDNIRAIPENLEKVSGIYQTNNYVPYLQIFSPTSDEISFFQDYLDTFGVNLGMMVDLRSRQFNYLQGTLIKYADAITNEEYVEICSQLTKGVRKYGGV